jgi:hypothetical protein
MRCLPTLFVALISAIVAAVLAGYIGDVASTAHHVSDMEGGRGWLILVCSVAGFLAGGVIGAVTTRIRVKTFASALLAAVLLDLALAAVAAGVAFLSADSAPKIDSHRLHLEFEVLLPAGQPLPKGGADTLTVTVAGFADQYRATLDQTQAAEQPAPSGELVLSGAERERARFAVPGSVPITSQSEHRALLVKLGGEPEQEFVLKLPRSPRKEDEAWSEWIAPHYETSSLPVAKERELAVRYRVQQD